MRDIEGIEEAVAKLKPHFAAIEQHFKDENRIFVGLITSPHDTLGRVLKCHLLVEHYLHRFLGEYFKIDTLDDARLTFSHKAALLPNRAAAAAFVKPGIVRLNVIRNRFCHSLGAELSDQDLGAIRDVLDIARSGVVFESPVEAIEAFTTVACTFLIVPPAALQQIFAEALSSVRVRVDAPESG